MQILEQILRQSKGKVLTVSFIKKDGSKREMNCRFGVKKGVKGTGRSRKSFDTVRVFDMQKGAYRTINLNTVFNIKMGGKQLWVVQ